MANSIFIMFGERLKIAIGDHKMAENRLFFFFLLQEIGDWSIRVYRDI